MIFHQIKEVKLNYNFVPLQLSVFAFTFFLSCSSNRQFTPPPPVPTDQEDISQPATHQVNVLADGFKRQFIDQGEQSVDLSRQWRNITNTRRQALNLDAFDEVPNSSWFTNRIGNAVFFDEASLDKIANGPCTGNGPDTTDVLTIVRAKSQGMAPGFWIRDKLGSTYIVKFDPIGYSESATGAEVVVTKIMHAIGYNVPENYVFYFHPAMLQLGDNVKFTDENGRSRSMLESDIAAILAKVEQGEDGYYRAHASKLIAGVPLGPFHWKGTRDDDPNDFVPHEHRRELRALRVFDAWVNNYDTNAGNVFDSYVTEGDRSYVKHYLIDFSGALGGYIFGPMPPTRGKENYFDPHQLALNIGSLGLKIHDWEKNWSTYKNTLHSSVGYFIADDFEPHEFKFTFPNEAFENMTNRDGYWAAKIVMQFERSVLKELVRTAKYTDPLAEEYIVNTLAARRNKIAKFYFNNINCLDFFMIDYGIEKHVLRFNDLLQLYHMEPEKSTEFRYSIDLDGKTLVRTTEIEAKEEVDLPKVQPTNMHGQWCITLQAKRESEKKWGKWVKVYLEVDENTKYPMIVGIVRQE